MKGSHLVNSADINRQKLKSFSFNFESNSAISESLNLFVQMKRVCWNCAGNACVETLWNVPLLFQLFEDVLASRNTCLKFFDQYSLQPAYRGLCSFCFFVLVLFGTHLCWRRLAEQVRQPLCMSTPTSLQNANVKQNLSQSWKINLYSAIYPLIITRLVIHWRIHYKKIWKSKNIEFWIKRLK